MEKNRITHCKNCGAPALTQICRYCKQESGLKENFTELEYQVIECKEEHYSVFRFASFLTIFFSILLCTNEIVVSHVNEPETIKIVYTIMWILIVILLIIESIPISRMNKLKKEGKEIEATVCGYLDDKYNINGKPTLIVKLLVNTNDGPKYILYQLKDSYKPFKLNSKIKLRVKQDRFIITSEKRYDYEQQ